MENLATEVINGNLGLLYYSNFKDLSNKCQPKMLDNKLFIFNAENRSYKIVSEVIGDMVLQVTIQKSNLNVSTSILLFDEIETK